MPMATNTIPPNRSAFSLRAMPLPKPMPISNPIMDMMNDTNPIMPMGEMIVDIWLYPKKAKVAPITNASILVAIANPNITLMQVGSKLCLSSSSLNDSTIICPPRKVKIPKAIQWSICSI